MKLARSGSIAAVLVVAAAGVAACGGDDSSGATIPAATTTPEPRKATAQAQPKKSRRAGTTIQVASSQFGDVIWDGRKQAVYLFAKEKGRRSECYGACAEAWPPVLTKGRPRAAKGAKQGLLGTTTRRDGRKQVTYGGHPLYYYDEPRGVISCHNVDEFGGLWLVVKPDGEAVQ